MQGCALSYSDRETELSTNDTDSVNSDVCDEIKIPASVGMTTVHIRNICRDNISQEDFAAEVLRLGFDFDFLYLVPVSRRYWNRKRPIRNRGFGFINFRTPECAARFIQVFQGYSWEAHPVPLAVAYAEEHGFDVNIDKHRKFERGNQDITRKPIVLTRAS